MKLWPGSCYAHVQFTVRALEKVRAQFPGAPVVALPCLGFLWLRFETEQGVLVCFWLLAAVWATDIGAYAVGRTVGGPRLLIPGL